MKQKIVKFTIWILVIFLIVGCHVAFAAGASASVSGGSVKVGETITVKVTFKCSDIGVAGGKLSYDANVLEFKSGSGANGGGGSVNLAVYASGSGQSSLTATIKFKALKAGSANLSLSGGNVIEFTSEASHSVSASGKVTVTETTSPTKTTAPTKTKTPEKTNSPTKSDTPQKTQTTTASPSPTATAAPVVEQLDGVNMTLVTDLTKIEIPEGFERSTTTYKNQTTACAVSENLTLLCFTDGNANYFYILRDGVLQKYRVILSVAKRYVFSDAEVTTPEGFTETKLTIGDTEERAWICENDERSGFYLLYLSENGNSPDFYQYDSDQATLQRYVNRAIIREVEVPVEVIVEKTPEPTPMPAGYFLSSEKILLCIAGSVLLAILLVVLLATSISRGKKLRKIRSDERERIISERSESTLPESVNIPEAVSEDSADTDENIKSLTQSLNSSKKKKKHKPAH